MHFKMDISRLLSAYHSAADCESSYHSAASSAVTQTTNPTLSTTTDVADYQPHRSQQLPPQRLPQQFLHLPHLQHPLPPISRLTSPLTAATPSPTFPTARTPIASPPSSSPLSSSSPITPLISTTFSSDRASHQPPNHHHFNQPQQGRVDKHANKPFKCVYEGCDASFGQKGSLTRHIRSRHEKLRPHCCRICQKSFSALWTLRVHQRNVHLKSKPHKCHLCDKSFGELFNKSKHIAIVHEGKRPFACPICSRAFGYKGDMRKHVLELHQQAGRPFQCIIPSCGVKFARKRYLRRHENLSHKAHPLLMNRRSPSPPPQTPPPSVSHSFATTAKPSLLCLAKPILPVHSRKSSLAQSAQCSQSGVLGMQQLLVRSPVASVQSSFADFFSHADSKS